MRALRAFEAAARHRSFSRAADELGTTQPAISRTITELERQLTFRLFERLHRGVHLTKAGEMYLENVVSGLVRIGEAGITAAGLWNENQVAVACPHAISEMFLMPRFHDLQRKLGSDVSVHVTVCDYDSMELLESHVDLVLSFDAGGSMPDDRVVAFREEMAPVCSPSYAEKHADIVRGPVAQWGSLTFLRHARPSRGWATWEDWFEVAGRPHPVPHYLNYTSYVYMIDAACAGHGIALGRRAFLGRYLDMGVLVTLQDSFVELDIACYIKLTEHGRRHIHARQCLDFFATPR